MAAEAVLLNHLLPCLPDVDGLRFLPECKDCGMAKAVACLEVVFPDEAVMRHMACIAVGDTTVCAMRPCGKLRGHNVTVDAYPGIIGKIGGGIGYLQQEEKDSRESSEDDNHRSSPVCRRREEADQFPWSAH